MSMAINIAVIMKKHEVLAKGKKEIMLLMTSTAFVVTVVMIVMGIPFCCYCCCSKKMMMVMVMVMTAAAAITFAMHYPIPTLAISSAFLSIGTYFGITERVS